MKNFSYCVFLRAIVIIEIVCILTLEAKNAGITSLEDSILFHSNNGTLSIKILENILKLIERVRPTYEDYDQNYPVHSKCLSVTEIISQYGQRNQSQLSMDVLENICPAILYQAAQANCTNPDPNSGKPITYHVWGYGFLAVTIINLSSLLGLALAPFTQKPCFPKVLTFFIGLAIGTLFSNAVLQLIPEALGFDPRADNYVLNAVGIFGGFYLLFFAETVLKMVLKTEHEHGHSHFGPHEPHPRANSLQNGDLGTKSDVIVATSFSSVSSHMTSTVSEPPTEQEEQMSSGSCHWLRGQRFSNIKTVAWMVSLSDALHNFIDGLAIGTSFSVSVLAGFSASIAIICEEFPHELGDFVILLNAGMSIPQAIFFNMLSAMSCYVGLALGILVGSSFAPNVVFALAGGMFLYIALADMFPEMNNILRNQERSTRNMVTFFLIQNAGLLIGFAVILLITIFAGEINLG